MRLSVFRSDGKVGRYLQSNARRAQMLAKRLDPETLFCKGPIVIGELNPFSILNPDEVCWIEVQADAAELKTATPTGVERVLRLPGREEYEAILARQWPRWRTKAKSKPGDLLEALVELSFRGGHVLYLHVTGYVVSTPLVQMIFGAPSINATFEPNGALYANPKALVRARVYHSMSSVTYPDGLWCAEADEI
jgi:hypothetical protein